jgi:uncharacterized protein
MVPRLAAIPALRGSFCRLSQYCRGHVSNRFHADGESVCDTTSDSVMFGHQLLRHQASLGLDRKVVTFIRNTNRGRNMAEAIVKISDLVDTKDATIFCCFPSVGMVSSIVAHYLIEKLELEFVGGVIDPHLPPLCLVQDGEPLPPIRAYAGTPICSPKLTKCDKVILLMSELIVPEPLVHGIVDALFNWSKSADLAVGVLIDAFAKQGMKSTMNGQEPVVEYEDSDDISVLGVGSTVKMRELIGSLGIKPLEQGVIKGITGVLLGEGRRRGLDIMSIMVEADPTIPDARAAATLISHLNELLPAIDLDHAPLLEEAERIEEQVRSMVEGTGETETSSSASSMIYG